MSNFACVLILENDENEILFLGRNKPPYGLGLVGGKSEDEETHLQTLLREVKEEIDLELNGMGVLKYVGINESTNGRVVHIYYLKLSNPKIKITNEHAFYTWIHKDKINYHYLAGNTIGFLNMCEELRNV